jgi:hypothetical protein
MARLSKDQLGDRGRFRFNQEDVALPELRSDEDTEDPTVLVRSPSVKQRDDLGEKLPADETEWRIPHVAILFSTIVVDPQLSPEEAEEFIGDWPGTALDRITLKFAELVGTKEVMREAAGDFQPGD